ncbi:MAG TPA: trypsin-like peptidase domain-containing protein [Rhizobacter sp.]|nr:trypsin-like peptidase domain-containing protein [Rhizobacter sp.]
MRQAPLYSRSPRRSEPPPLADPLPPSDEAAAPAVEAASPAPRASRWAARRERIVWLAAGALLVFAGLFANRAVNPPGPPLTQKDIDNSVRHSLEKDPLPSAYAKAYAAIGPSVVLIEGDDDDEAPTAKPTRADKDKKSHDQPDTDDLHRHSTGTGVVIVDNGTILTNLHVVVGSKRLRVTFADGHESEATLVNVQPENDLAVLRATSIPDDLQAATMRSTSDLAPGDEVIAVGYPFGIGPSVSGGVVSGLKREFRAPQGRMLTNLIQFDAAANPGNSGGPLVTMDGSVVGIVTAILNPTEARTFLGIGFAVPIENAAAAAGMPPF